MRKLNSAVEIEAIPETITESNVSRLMDGCEVIVDAMDNLPTRYILNQCAIEKNIPFFHGAVTGFEGRAMTILPGKTACLVYVSRSGSAREISRCRCCSCSHRGDSGDRGDQVSLGNWQTPDQSVTNI